MPDNESPLDKVLTLIGGALVLAFLFTLCSLVPDALQAAIR
jgi:hypothetical protein